jgi:GNAT superfamily N-acetyltransferase
MPPAVAARRLWVARAGTRLVGACVLEALPWDSELYGLGMAKLEWALADAAAEAQRAAAAALLGQLVPAARQQRIGHLAARTFAGDYGLGQALEAQGFRFVDTTVTLTRFVDGSPRHSTPAGIRLAKKGDIRALQDVAAGALVDGRVDHDPGFPQRLNRELYRRWVANACRGRSEVVLVYPAAGRPVGFVCCNVDRRASASLAVPLGFVDLLAVAPSMQGRGIGRKLLQAALAWFSDRVRLVEIRAQLANVVSLSLYQQEGFRIMSSGIALPAGHAFHQWLDSSRDGGGRA